VNGHALAQNLKVGPVGYEYTLNPSLLRAGRNVIALYVTRFSDANKKIQAFQWDGPGPAAVQVLMPAPPWKRSVFNGLAQVIVQSKQEAGEITLTATSPGLSPAVVKIASQTRQPR
jgi:beta-galactosidase